MKKNFKTILMLVLCTVLAIGALALSGCQKSGAVSGKTKVKIGMTQIVLHDSLDMCRQGAIDKLAELGYVEGENLEIVFQDAQGDPAVGSTIAQQFVADNVDMILAIATPSAQAAYAAGMEKGIPVVFSAVTDPIAAQLAAPDGSALDNITGTSDQMPIPEAFDLIKKLVPDAVKVGILHNTSEVNSDVQLAQARQVAAEAGMEVIDIGITSTNEIASALDALLPQVDVVLNLTDNMVVSSIALEVEKCLAAGVPLFGSEETQVMNGAFASAGVDYYNLGLQTGAIMAQILSGTPARDIPYETLKDCIITINTEVAAQLGIAIPEGIEADMVTTTTQTGEE